MIVLEQDAGLMQASVVCDPESAPGFLEEIEESEEDLQAQKWHRFVCNELGRIGGREDIVVDYEVTGRQELIAGALYNMRDVILYTKKDEGSLSSVVPSKLASDADMAQLDPEVRKYIDETFNASIRASKVSLGWHRDK